MTRNREDYQPTDLVMAGGATGICNFIFKCLPDLWYITQIAQSLKDTANTTHYTFKQFFQKSKGAIFWDFHYRMLMGFYTLPAQFYLEQRFLRSYNGKELTNSERAMISSIAGWNAALTEILIAHPLDSMRTAINTNPALFSPYCGIPYFRRHFWQLYSGVGAGILRNTCSNPPAWCAKTLAEIQLKETHFSENTQLVITALVLSVVRFIAGYPLDVIKTVLQCDAAKNNFIAEKRSMVRHLRYAIQLTQQQIKKEGLSFLTTGLSVRLSWGLVSTVLQYYVFRTMMDYQPSRKLSDLWQSQPFAITMNNTSKTTNKP